MVKKMPVTARDGAFFIEASLDVALGSGKVDEGKEGLLFVNKKKQKNVPLWFRVRTGSSAPWTEGFFACLFTKGTAWRVLHL